MTSIQKLSRWRGSNFERRVAKLVHGIVCGRSKAVKVGDKWIQINPQQPPDVVNAWASFECKSRRDLPDWFRAGICQAGHNAPDGHNAYLVIYDRQERCTYVVETMKQWLDMHEGV